MKQINSEREKTTQSQSSQSSLTDKFENLSAQPEIPSIEIEVQSIDSNANECIFKCDISINLEVIPQNLITDIFIEKSLIIQEGSMACISHFVDDSLMQFKPEEIRHLKPINETSVLTEQNIKSLLLGLREKCLSQLKFNDEIFDKMSEEELRETTGVSTECFNQMKTYVKLNASRSDSFALGIFLTQLRSDSTTKSLSFRFNVPKTTLLRYITIIRTQLAKNFVPLWVGLNCENMRSRIKNNTSFFANAIHEISDKNIMTVWDATYIYCEKSGVDYTFQKDSFSVHKGRNLVKPMLGCTTNGYFIEATPPKKAYESDSTILNDLMKDKSSGFDHFFVTGDMFILDKGFIRSKTTLQNEGMLVQIPLSAPYGNKSKHLSWQLANESRLVTKLRWVVELCFGSIKNKFKKFTHTWPTVSLKHLMDDFRIACAVHNLDTQRYESDKIDQLSILKQIENTKDKPNL